MTFDTTWTAQVQYHPILHPNQLLQQAPSAWTVLTRSLPMHLLVHPALFLIRPVCSSAHLPAGQMGLLLEPPVQTLFRVQLQVVLELLPPENGLRRIG